MSAATAPARLTATRTFEILEVLGRGAFGTVYKARQIGELGFARDVAIKVTHEPGSSTSRLRQEARILCFVRHRAFVHVDDLVEVDGGLGLVMELVDGVDLARVFALGPMPIGAAAEIVLEVAGALDCAQKARGPEGRPMLLQHRDLKPANIMITATGEIKLLDFGVAHVNLVDELQEPAPSYGSRGYVAPERLCGAPHVNSDIYSLGVVFFEVLSGQRFGSPPLDARNHTTWCQRALRALSGGVPPAARRLLAEMLAWSPEERPTAREVERRAAAIARSAGTRLRDWTEGRLPDPRFRHAASARRDGPTAAERPAERTPVASRPEPPEPPPPTGASQAVPAPARPTGRVLPLVVFSLVLWGMAALALLLASR